MPERETQVLKEDVGLYFTRIRGVNDAILRCGISSSNDPYFGIFSQERLPITIDLYGRAGGSRCPEFVDFLRKSFRELGEALENSQKTLPEKDVFEEVVTPSIQGSTDNTSLTIAVKETGNVILEITDNTGNRSEHVELGNKETPIITATFRKIAQGALPLLSS